MGKILDLKEALGRIGDTEAQAQHKRLAEAEKMYLDAIEAAGKKFENGKIVSADDEDEEKEKTAESGGKYLFDGEDIEAQKLPNVVKQISQNKFPRGNHVGVMCPQPIDLYNKIGMNTNLYWMISATHISDALKPKDRTEHTHGLTKTQISNIPNEIKAPVMILDSIDKNGKIIENNIIVVTSEVDEDGCPVIIPICTTGKGKHENVEISCNYIKSVYGRNKFSEWLQKHIDADAVLYINKEKAVQLEAKSNTQ